ncbi:hypothetical protein TIFTF001_007205 [Ficus carica]|uniref:GH10 domain-containing protein n=1 Tax=Ficus carica TaxID=3494 RepID=A0AA87ZQM6_FICCA|nr:hypothetical protein TIFTF001_007205 [Ficus carica]
MAFPLEVTTCSGTIPKSKPSWVYSLSHDELQNAVEKQINSVVSRYRGKLIAWDVDTGAYLNLEGSLYGLGDKEVLEPVR